MAVREPEAERRDLVAFGNADVERILQRRVTRDGNGVLDFDAFWPVFKGERFPEPPHDCDWPECDQQH